MDSLAALSRRRRAWRTLFSCALAVLLLFSLWISAALAAGRSPMALVRTLLLPARRGARAFPIPISQYLDDEYGILAIAPADNRADSVNRNGRRIVISFRDPMETDVSRVLTAWDVTTNGEESLDFGNLAWPDPRTFTVMLSRDLAPAESVQLRLGFRTADGEPVRTVWLTYE
jgi:hypothetical protein